MAEWGLFANAISSRLHPQSDDLLEQLRYILGTTVVLRSFPQPDASSSKTTRDLISLVASIFVVFPFSVFHIRLSNPCLYLRCFGVSGLTRPYFYFR